MSARLKLKDLAEIVENDIVNLAKTFRDNPTIFLSEHDVQSYLYSLLINEPIIRNFLPTVKYLSEKGKSRKTRLVHTETQGEIHKRDRKVDITIFPPKEIIDDPDWYNMIGIEIKYNRRIPARKEPSNILGDVIKVADFKRGYILWLNWEIEINDGHLRKVEKLVAKFRNVKMFYLDVFSDPIKTNIPNL